MKQISIQITEETARQMARLAQHWGLPRERHNTAVLERAVATMFLLVAALCIVVAAGSGIVRVATARAATGAIATGRSAPTF